MGLRLGRRVASFHLCISATVLKKRCSSLPVSLQAHLFVVEKKRGAVTAEALELDRERKHAAHPPHSPEWECGASQPAVEGPQTHQDLVHDGGAEAIYTTLNSTTQNGCSGGILRPESPATQCRASVMEERKNKKEMLSVFFGAVRDAWAVASESTVTPQRETASSSIRSAMRQFWVRA